MNPSEFTKQPIASTSNLNSISESTPSTLTASNPTTIIKNELIDSEMIIDNNLDPILIQEELPKTKKELDQENKDLNLIELLELMEDWKPIIPDEVTDYYLQRSGFETSDLRVKRLLALAAQRFVSSISADAFQYARTRTAAGTGSKNSNKDSNNTSKIAKDRTRTVLTMEDLSSALKEYGVGADRAQYYL